MKSERVQERKERTNDERKVNHVFAESDSSSVRADGDTELGGHEENGEDL